MQGLLPELVERLNTADAGTAVGVLETANSVLKRSAAALMPQHLLIFRISHNLESVLAIPLQGQVHVFC